MQLTRKILIIVLSFIAFLIVSCESTKTPDSTDSDVTTVVYTDDSTADNTLEIDNTSDLPDIEEPEIIDELEEEYLRSINNLTDDEFVTKQEFSEDKATILHIIDELSKIMETKDAKAWKKYIEPDSIKYYSNPVNLRNAQKKLPIKTITLNSIDDYFVYVFIPSRKRSRVDEIRYISKTNIKVVQVKEDFSTVVYYYFKKIDDNWYVHLPPV